MPPWINEDEGETMRVLLMPNFTKPRTWEVAEELCRKMARLGMTAVAAKSDREAMAAAGIGPVEGDWESLDEAACSCDIILSIGGDGTMIHSAYYAACSGRPVVGVDLGRLGFLAQIGAADLERYLLRLRDGDYTREKRYAIRADFSRGDCPPLPFAINDIVFMKAPEQNLVEFEISCGGRLIDRYRADGLIFSTPTGSTAYALSAGGPVMDPSLRAVTMVPICPHAMAVRPMVFAGGRTVTLRSRGELFAVADGARRVLLPAGETATVGASRLEPEFISFGENEFFQVITAKLSKRGYGP